MAQLNDLILPFPVEIHHPLPNEFGKVNWSTAFSKYVSNLHVNSVQSPNRTPPIPPLQTTPPQPSSPVSSPQPTSEPISAASNFDRPLPSLSYIPACEPSTPALPTSPFLMNASIDEKALLLASLANIPIPLPIDLPHGDNNFQADPKASFRCLWDNCNQTFSTRTGLATHCSSHLAPYQPTNNSSKRVKMNIQCRWARCCDVFYSLKDLAKHLAEDSHIGQTPFLAKEHDEELVEKSKKIKRYACSYPSCGRMFADSSNRKKHERTHDVNRERFYCTEQGCTKSYSTKTDLNIHMKAHKGDFPHKCTFPNCNKVFVRLSELYAHERSHDNILPHLCTTCGKRFREKARLKQHEESHIMGPTM